MFLAPCGDGSGLRGDCATAVQLRESANDVDVGQPRTNLSTAGQYQDRLVGDTRARSDWLAVFRWIAFVTIALWNMCACLSHHKSIVTVDRSLTLVVQHVRAHLASTSSHARHRAASMLHRLCPTALLSALPQTYTRYRRTTHLSGAQTSSRDHCSIIFDRDADGAALRKAAISKFAGSRPVIPLPTFNRMTP